MIAPARGHCGRRARRVCLVLLCLFGLLGTADAQRLRFRSSGRVAFAPTSEVYLAALGGSVEPEPSSPNIRMRVDKSKRYTFRVEPSSRPAGAPELQARLTFSSKKDDRYVTPWLSLDEPWQEVIARRDKRTEISVEYRAQLSGGEVAGSYTTSLTYRAGNSSVRHDVRVVVPTATSLRVERSLVTAQTATLEFDYSGKGVMTYLRATETLTPLSATSSDIRTLEVFTNNPQGYTVTVSVVQDDVLPNPASASLTDRLYLAGQSAEGRRFSTASPTYGFEPLLSPSDFSLSVDGSEQPGDYTFRLIYDVRPNP